MSVTAMTSVPVEELSTEQAHAAFDAACRRALDVSGEEFLRVYQSGALPEDWPAETVTRLEMLLPLAQ